MKSFAQFAGGNGYLGSFISNLNCFKNRYLIIRKTPLDLGAVKIESAVGGWMEAISGI
jgi:hypothetical protein